MPIRHNGSEPLKMEAISLSHTICSASVCIHDKVLKIGKLHRYNDTRKIAKLLISQSSYYYYSVQMAYHKIAKSTRPP